MNQLDLTGSSTGLRIRDGVPGEEEMLRSVFMSSVHGLARGHYTDEQLAAWAPLDHDREAWRAKIAANRPFVAEIDGRIGGYTDLQPSGHIDHFFVSAQFAGRGVGTALMRHIHAVAQARDLAQLDADVSLAAEGFFARNGFAVVARQAVPRGSVVLANARMVKVLAFTGTRRP